jgi:hypothetical protein
MTTINQFFNTQNGSSNWAAGILNNPNFDGIKRRMIQEFKGITIPPSAYELLIMKLSDAMDIKIGDILVWAFRKQREILQYRDPAKYPHGEDQVVYLLEHTIISKHSPTIQPKLNKIPGPKIKFDIVLKLRLKGAKLIIRDAKIIKLLTGTCIGSGSVEYEGFALLEKKTSPFELPGSIPFEAGIPI